APAQPAKGRAPPPGQRRWSASLSTTEAHVQQAGEIYPMSVDLAHAVSTGSPGGDSPDHRSFGRLSVAAAKSPAPGSAAARPPEVMDSPLPRGAAVLETSGGRRPSTHAPRSLPAR